MTPKELAKQIIISYFNDLSTKDRLTLDGFQLLFEIKSNDEILLENIKAFKSIFEKAIKEMEEDK